MQDTERLLELVDRKRQILAQLCQQGLKQLQLVDRNELGELINVLAVKQQLIAALAQTQRALDPFRGQRPEDRHWRTPDQRTRCSKLLEDCETLLAETIRQERESESLLRKRRDEAADRLSDASHSRQARQAYVSQDSLSPRQLDLASEN